MNDKLNIWLQRIDRISSEFELEFGTLSVEEFNFKPGLQSWSVAQVIEHLVNTTASYLPVINKAIVGNYNLPLTAKIPGFPGLMGRLIYKTVHPDNRKKTKTFKVWQPEHGNLPKEILDQFLVSQQHLKQLIIKSSDKHLKEVLISSPANRFIVYDLENAFDIIITHQDRHLRQARDVKTVFAGKKR